MVGCGIFAFNRPDYLKQLLNSIENASGTDEITFYLFQDGEYNPFSDISYASTEDIFNSVKAFKEARLKRKKIVRRDRNYGIPVNVYYGVCEVFRNHPVGIFLEDDIAVAPDYFDLIREMLSKFGGVVKAGERPSDFTGIEAKESIGGTNWATTVENWRKIEKKLSDFVTDMKNTDYAQENPLNLRDRYGAPTQDAIRSKAFRNVGIDIWETQQPKVRVVGTKGFHGANKRLLEVTDEDIKQKIEI